MTPRFATLACALLFSVNAFAEVDPMSSISPVRQVSVHECSGSGDYKEGMWCGYVEPALNVQSGHSEVQQFSWDSALSYRKSVWQAGAQLRIDYTRSEGVLTDDNYELNGRVANHYNDANAIYVGSFYEAKRLQKYSYLTGASLGLQHSFATSDSTSLSASIGGGVRNSETTSNQRETVSTQDLAVEGSWAVNDILSIDASAAVSAGNFGQALTTSQYNLSISSQLGSHVSAVLSGSLEHFSRVPEGRKSTVSARLGLRYSI